MHLIESASTARPLTLLEITRNYLRLLEITIDYLELLEITRDYQRMHLIESATAARATYRITGIQ